MIKTAVCEDEAPARAYLVSLIRAQPCSCQIVEYASAADCQAAGRQPVLVLVTGYERYVIDAFEVGAFNYLLKPVDEEKFARVFARAVEQITAGQGKSARALTLQSAGVSRTVPLDSIYYIESS